LVVIGLDLARLGDVDVIAQAVEQLRPVRLRIGGLGVDGLDVRLPSVAVTERIDVEALGPLPLAGQRRQRPEVGQGVDVDVFLLGVDVFGQLFHEAVMPSFCDRINRQLVLARAITGATLASSKSAAPSRSMWGYLTLVTEKVRPLLTGVGCCVRCRTIWASKGTWSPT